MVDNIYHFPKWFLSISIDVFCEITKKNIRKKIQYLIQKNKTKKNPQKQIKQKTETIKKSNKTMPKKGKYVKNV